MIKTKIKKAIAALAIVGIAFSTTHATQIGTGSVTGSAALDTAINWNDTYTAGSASGQVTGIVVTATVEPVLNVTFSTGGLNLGVLTPGTTKTESLNIEVGTNAANGVRITARSSSGGLTNINDNTTQILSTNTGEKYEWLSTHSADTAVPSGFSQTGALTATAITDNTTEHDIYTTTAAEPVDGINDITFSVNAQADYVTSAGEYKDVVTFTITGNF